jgi:hypothetical protein
MYGVETSALTKADECYEDFIGWAEVLYIIQGHMV